MGLLVTLTGGSTTTLVDTTSVLTGAYPADRWMRGTPIRYSTLNGAASTETSTFDLYDPAIGTVTLTPATSASKAADKAEIWSEVDSVTRVDEAIDRGLIRHCWHWVPIPLTVVPDGDMGDAAYAHWTASSSTVSKVSQAWPSAWGQRYLRVLNAGYAASDAIKVQAGDTWVIDVLVYVAVGAATLVVYDQTNSAAITISGDGGDYSGTGWKRLHNTFTIPTDCESISIRLGSTGTNDDSYWTAIVAHPQARTLFTLPSRINSIQQVGNTFFRAGEEYEDFHFEPYVEHGRTVKLVETPTGVTVQLAYSSWSTGLPYIEELRPYEALATDASTTECADDLAIWSGIYELYCRLAQRDSRRETKSGYLSKSDLADLRDDALMRMQGFQRSLGPGDRRIYR